MALKDQLIYGIHVGLVIDSFDPDNLGRIKVLVPGKLGSVYTGWNDLETDITFSSATSDVFDQEKIERIKKVIPWSRPAMPLWGGGTGSFNETSTGTPFVNPPDSAFGSANLTGENGRLNPNDPNQLVKVGNEYLNPIFAGKLQELQAAAAKDGISFTLQGGQGYRAGSLQAQYYANYTQQNVTWEGVTYSPQKQGGIAAAPGASNHGWGNAVDIQQTGSTSRTELVNWLWSSGNAINLGFTNYKGEAAYPSIDQLHVQISRNDIGKYASYSVTKPTTTLNAGQSQELQGALGMNTGKTSPFGTAFNGPIDNRKAVIDATATANGKGAGTVAVGTASQGPYNPTSNKTSYGEQYNRVLNIIKDKETFNKGTAPAGGERFGVTSGDPQTWSSWFSELAGWESGFDPSLQFKTAINGSVEPGGSGGLYQLGLEQFTDATTKNPNLAISYGLEPGRKYTADEFYNVDLNTRMWLFGADYLLRQQYAIQTNELDGGRAGIGRTIGYNFYDKTDGQTYPSTLRKMELARQGDSRWASEKNNILGGKGGEATERKMVQRITNQGVNAFGSVNGSRPGSPTGSFSIPMVGAKVWVMFEGGSPQRPVYIAQAYDPSNIRAYNA